MVQTAIESTGLSLILPHHVAVIMDGNGRWAKARGRSRIEGHREGASRVRQVVRAARKHGIEHLTLFALSTQNLQRPPDEVDSLLTELRQFMRHECQEMIDRDIRFTLMGDVSQLPAEVRKIADEVKTCTACGDEMCLTVAVAYGGQEDLIAGLREVITSGAPVSAEHLERCLWSSHLPPVDLLIRTGGEHRISNFMLWHLAYAELHFTDVLWPDFDLPDFDRALLDFSNRQRRYGQLP